MDKFIPISYSIIVDKTFVNLYYFHNYIRWNFNTQFVSFDGKNKRYLVATRLKQTNAARERLCVSRQAWAAAGGNRYPEVWNVVDEPVAMMPFAVFDLAMEKLLTLPMKSRNPLWRLYCYMYFNDAHYGGEFQRAQEQMAIDLNMSLKSVNSGLKKLIDWGLLRREGRYRFSGETSFAYRHRIPSELKCEDLFHEEKILFDKD